MPDQLMYCEDHYVVLEPGQGEVFLTAEEMLQQLQKWLQTYPQASLPPDVQRYKTEAERAKALLDGSCVLEIEPGRSIQWYAVRLDKP